MTMKKTWLVAGLAAAGIFLGSVASANTTQIEVCINVSYLPNGNTIAGTAGLAQNGTMMNSIPLTWVTQNTYCATVPQIAGATQVYVKPNISNTNLTQVNLMGNAFTFANVQNISHVNISAYYLTTTSQTTYDITPFVWWATYEDGAREGFDGPGTPVKDPEHENPSGTTTGDATGSGDLRCQLTITPSTSGPAPFTVNVMGTTNWGQFVVLYWGDGGWVNNPVFGPISHTYLTPGNYQLSAGVAGNNNTQFEKCLGNVVVTPGSAVGTGTTNPNGTTTGTTTTGTTNPGNPNTNPGNPNTNPGNPNTNPGNPNTNPGNPNTNPVQTGPWTNSHADASVAIMWMHNLGLTKYNTFESFQAGSSITREQAAKFFAQFATKVMNKTPNTTLACEFNDSASFDSTLAADVKLACQLGLFKGAKGNFMPKAAITAAEMVTVAMRLKYGMLTETGANWWAAYQAKASELGLINDLNLEFANTTKGAARVNAAFILYRLSNMLQN